ASELCIAPTTVPASSRASPLGAGAPSSEIAPPSSEATTLSSGAGSSLPTLWPPPPWWWPVSWPSARCGIEGSTSNSASMLPVAITSPAAPASLSTLPETGEGTSTTALAVSIETRFSSSRMVSPSLTYHSTMVASGRPSPRSGRRNFLLMSASLRVGEGALGRRDDLVHAREVLHLQAEQRDVGVVAGDALDRGDQVEHALLGQARGDLGAEARGLRGLVHDHATAGLGHRLGDGVEVQRGQGGDVDDLGADAVLRQRVGGFEGLLHLRAPGHQGDVAAVAQHVAHVQRQRLAVIGHQFLVLAVDALGLHVDHRIRIADRGQQHAGVARRRGSP